jgi:SprT protein
MRDRYIEVLSRYLPEAAVHSMADCIIEYGFHLKITRERSSKLGDFRPEPGRSRGHHITINYNLNAFSFLITLVHEIAHLVTWNEYGMRVKPHGKEWKQNFSRLMKPYLNGSIFPEPVLLALSQYLKNPSSSSCNDTQLMRSLRQFDEDPVLHLEDLPEASLFKLKSGRVFKKGPRQRKNFRCEELQSKRIYLVHPLAEVEWMADAG